MTAISVHSSVTEPLHLTEVENRDCVGISGRLHLGPTSQQNITIDDFCQRRKGERGERRPALCLAVSLWTGDIEDSCLLYTAQTVCTYMIRNVGMLLLFFQSLVKLSIHEELEKYYASQATKKIFLG